VRAPFLPTAFARAAEEGRIGWLCFERAVCRGLHASCIERGRCSSSAVAVPSEGTLARNVTTEYSRGASACCDRTESGSPRFHRSVNQSGLSFVHLAQFFPIQIRASGAISRTNDGCTFTSSIARSLSSGCPSHLTRFVPPPMGTVRGYHRGTWLLWVRRSTAERPSPLRVCRYLSYNALNGTVPCWLSALTKLEELCVPRSCQQRLRVRPRRVGSVGGCMPGASSGGGAVAALLRYSQRGPLRAM
jgi:hypothetical protein